MNGHHTFSTLLEPTPTSDQAGLILSESGRQATLSPLVSSSPQFNRLSSRESNSPTTPMTHESERLLSRPNAFTDVSAAAAASGPRPPHVLGRSTVDGGVASSAEVGPGTVCMPLGVDDNGYSTIRDVTEQMRHRSRSHMPLPPTPPIQERQPTHSFDTPLRVHCDNFGCSVDDDYSTQGIQVGVCM